MGFSKSVFEQYKREIRILQWVLAVGALAAAGFHLFSVPAIIRYADGLMKAVDPTVELETTPVEIIVVDEPITPEPEVVTPPPPTEASVTNEPAAGAEEASPLPLASDPVVPEPATAESMDTVATGPTLASETGAEDGKGAAGEVDTVGILPGSGSPEGDSTVPITPPPMERQPMQEVARPRPPRARTVACNPCTQPDYPLTERRDRIEGQPVINVIFDPNGNVVRADIEKSSGNAAFDQAALEEARRNWRFRDPYGLGGQVSVEVTFVIAGSEQHDAAQAAGRQETIELPVQQSLTPVTPPSAGATPTVPTEQPTEPPSPSAPEPAENADNNGRKPAESESTAPDETLEPAADSTERPETPSVTPDPNATDSTKPVAPSSPALIPAPNVDSAPPTPVPEAKPIPNSLPELEGGFDD